MIKQKELYWLRGGMKRSSKEDDFSRPLDETGKKQALRMQEYLKTHSEIHPGIVFCSKAVRSRQMWEIVSEAMPRCHVIFNHFLYLASGYTVLEIIESVDEGINSILILGHAKALNELPALMSIDGYTPNDDIATDIEKGTFVHLVFDENVSWGDIHFKKAHLKDIFYP